MAAGVKIVNDWGTLLIDDTFPTLVVRGSGAINIGSEGFTSIGNQMGNGVGTFALRSTSLVGIVYMNYSEPFPAGYYIFGPPGAYVEYWVFDVPVNPVSNFGLIVRNSAGQLMFDALSKFMRVQDIRSSSSRAGWQGTFNYDNSRRWAVLHMQTAIDFGHRFTRVGAGGGQNYFEYEDINLAGGAVNNGSIQLGMTATRSRQCGPYQAPSLPGNFTQSTNNSALGIIDMTNY